MREREKRKKLSLMVASQSVIKRPSNAWSDEKIISIPSFSSLIHNNTMGRTEPVKGQTPQTISWRVWNDINQILFVAGLPASLLASSLPSITWQSQTSLETQSVSIPSFARAGGAQLQLVPRTKLGLFFFFDFFQWSSISFCLRNRMETKETHEALEWFIVSSFPFSKENNNNNK